MESMKSGTPWLDQPLTFHSSREYECTLDTPEQCLYQQGYWRYWYEADRRYALPTVAFFLATIVCFAISRIVSPGRYSRRLTAAGRYLSYRLYRISKLNWNSAPTGVLLLGCVGTIFFVAMVLGPRPYYWPSLDWGSSPPLATRSGWMSLACLPFVFATAGKSNLITLLTGVSHEKLQVFHRWISYAMYVLALLHTFPFIVNNIRNGKMVMSWNTSVFYWTGLVALLAQTYLTFASMGPLRSLAYEWFKYTHSLAGLVFVLFMFFHCDYTLTSWDYFVGTGVIFSLTWLHRRGRVVLEHGIGICARVDEASGGFVQLTVPTSSRWTVDQHYFIRFLSLGTHALTSHPFTACSLPDRRIHADGTKNELVFCIRPRGGVTARLAKYAETHPNSQLRVLLDGPYGGVDMQKLAQAQYLLVIAGGSGAGWILPLLTAYLRRLNLSDEKALSMRIVLATRDAATRQWFEDTVADTIRSTYTPEGSPPGLEVQIYHTRGENMPVASEVTSRAPSVVHGDLERASVDRPTQVRLKSDLDFDRMSSRSSCTCREGRPDVASIIAAEAATAGTGLLGVYVCGPLSMQYDCANAVASEQVAVMKGTKRDVYLHLEHFSWA